MQSPSPGFVSLLAALLILPAVGAARAAAPPLPEYRAFGAPERVTIRGYQGDAMEPFITRDGRYLLFNNRNDPRIDTRLHYAQRINDLVFRYAGEIGGVNTPALEGVPSLDRDGNLYFVSTRSYAKTLATIYRARFDRGRTSGLQLVPGISRLQPGIVTFDAEISADGRLLFFADGRFTGGHVPETADIDIAVRSGAAFRRLVAGRALLKHVNTDALEYAPAISSNLLELFFTRLEGSGATIRVRILRAARRSRDAPFGRPQWVRSITGFAEAPTLTNDGRSLYYHKLEGRRYVILRVLR